MNLKTLLISIAVVAALVGGILYIERPQPSKTVGDYNGYPIFSLGSTTGVLCGLTNTQLVATSTSRNFISISNTGTSTMFISLGTNASLNTGISLFTNTTIRFDSNALYSGAINCIDTNAATATIEELK